jgi:hypothetical protein
MELQSSVSEYDGSVYAPLTGIPGDYGELTLSSVYRITVVMYDGNLKRRLGVP